MLEINERTKVFIYKDIWRTGRWHGSGNKVIYRTVNFCIGLVFMSKKNVDLSFEA